MAWCTTGVNGSQCDTRFAHLRTTYQAPYVTRCRSRDRVVLPELLLARRSYRQSPALPTRSPTQLLLSTGSGVRWDCTKRGGANGQRESNRGRSALFRVGCHRLEGDHALTVRWMEPRSRKREHTAPGRYFRPSSNVTVVASVSTLETQGWPCPLLSVDHPG